MNRIKSFFKHKFVIVSMCFILIGTLPLIVMGFIPRAKTYTNKDTVRYEHMGEAVVYRLTFEDDKNYYIDYVNKQGKVVKERAITGTYEIKDGVLYNALGKWGEISVYGIEVKFAGILDAGYECKPAKYSRIVAIGLIAVGSLMFILAAYVGLTKKKKQVPVTASSESYINKKIINNAPEVQQHNPLARKLPHSVRKIVHDKNNTVNTENYQPQQNNVDYSQTVNQPQQNNVNYSQTVNQPQQNNVNYSQTVNQSQDNNIYQSHTINQIQENNTFNQEKGLNTSDIQGQSGSFVNQSNNTYDRDYQAQDNYANYTNSTTSVENQEQTSDAYDDLVNAIEENTILEEAYDEDSEQNILNSPINMYGDIIGENQEINQNETPEILSDKKVYFGEGLESPGENDTDKDDNIY